MEGILVRSTGSWYEVMTEDGVKSCRLRGNFRLKGIRSTNPLAVGDEVSINRGQDDTWVIESMKPRRNYIIRRASNLSKESHVIASNIDLAMVAVTLVQPETALEFIDRFLVTAEAYKVPVLILLMKSDLLVNCSENVQNFRDIYGSAGYEVLEVSQVTGQGVEELRSRLKGKTTLIAGNSGVGKSSLINAIEPSAQAKSGDISSVHQKGKHTTTFSTMYMLEDGGKIIDTPGIKGFGLIDIGKDELWHYFPEMLEVGQSCRFYNCTHTHEPHCAVIEAVEEGRIAYSRYESYLKIMEDDEKYR